MAKIEIEIKDLLYPTLTSIAAKEGFTSEKYAGNIVESWLEGQYRGSVIDKIKFAKVEDLAVIKDNKLSELTDSIKKVIIK